MELIEVLRSRRSIRKFKPDPVPDELLTEILEAARLAPSGTNLQPWRFVLIKSAPKRRALLGHTVSFVASAPVVVACLADLTTYQTHKPKRIKELTAAGAFTGIDLDFADSRKYWRERAHLDAAGIREYVSVNCATSIEHLVLRAADLGLGTCWVMMFDHDAVHKILEISDNLFVLALIPIGYSAQDPESRPRLPLSDILIKEI